MQEKFDFDIVVYGSTSGAVAAAITAARLGRSVGLISPQEHIGELPCLPVLPSVVGLSQGQRANDALQS